MQYADGEDMPWLLVFRAFVVLVVSGRRLSTVSGQFWSPRSGGGTVLPRLAGADGIRCCTRCPGGRC